eukprot:NODE_8_length_66115_cov_0.981823.p24 type:complete len:287 gc:universal NODE_8_length_66115_cov_0.981823:5962-5102(-)
MTEIATEKSTTMKRTAEQEEARKRKKSAYKKTAFKNLGSADELLNKKGLLITFTQGRYKSAHKELFNLILDAAEDLKLEYDEINLPFQIVDLGIKCLFFCELKEWDPTLICNSIFESMSGTGHRFIQNIGRIIPCVTISANMEEIMRKINALLQFDDKEVTFAVTFNSRYCEKFKEKNKNMLKIVDTLLTEHNGSKEITKKEYIEEKHAKLKKRGIEIKNDKEIDNPDELVQVPILNGKLKVNLENPKCMVNVDVFKTVACVSTLSNYRKYRKYNIQSVAKERFLE